MPTPGSRSYKWKGGCNKGVLHLPSYSTRRFKYLVSRLDSRFSGTDSVSKMYLDSMQRFFSFAILRHIHRCNQHRKPRLVDCRHKHDADTISLPIIYAIGPQCATVCHLLCATTASQRTRSGGDWWVIFSIRSIQRPVRIRSPGSGFGLRIRMTSKM